MLIQPARRALLCLAVLAAALLPVGSDFASTTVALAAEWRFDPPADYAIPEGRFFPLGLLDRHPEYGFTVDDGGGVRFWSEYERLDGRISLGLPSSRRFTWDDKTTQTFERGALVWYDQLSHATAVSLETVGTPPYGAVQLEPPAIAEGGMPQPAWSGWWWPATERVGSAHLFDFDGPLARYDRYAVDRFGNDPTTLVWERENVMLSEDAPIWAGHCNGWAAAALVEPEPTEPIAIDGHAFTVGDQKGLLSDYHFADAALWAYGSTSEPLGALDFHRQVLHWMVDGGRGMVVVFNPGDEETWSYPAYRARVVFGSDRQVSGVTHVSVTLWMADNSVPADFVGTQDYPGPSGRTIDYRLRGDRAAPDAVEWEGASLDGGFSRPAQIWYPNPEVRNTYRPLTSPNLDYAVIQEILRGGPPTLEAPSPAPTSPDDQPGLVPDAEPASIGR